MAKGHNTFESLQAEILKRAQKSLEGSTGAIIVNELHKNSKTVEGWNSRASSGIGDIKNIESEVRADSNELELTVKNSARPNPELPDGTQGYYTPAKEPGTAFTEMIETGSWRELPLGSHSPRPARPFVMPTQDAVNGPLRGKIINSIKKDIE